MLYKKIVKKKNKMKKTNVIVVGIILSLMIGSMGLVSAMSTHEQDVYDKIDNFFVKLKYGIQKGLFFFTSWGESNCCATDSTGYNNEGDYVGYEDFWLESGDRIDCTDVCSYDKCAIDYYPDITNYDITGGGPTWQNINWNLWAENHGDNAYLIVPSTYDWYWIEVYCCPEEYEIGDWETDVIVCEDNQWKDKGSYEEGESCPYGEYGCWCNEEDENFYVDESGGEHCRKPSYSSVNDGTWCSEYVRHYEKDCVAGITSALYWYDSNGNRNDLIEQCSSDEYCTLDGCIGEDEDEDDDEIPIVLDAVISDISIPSSVKSGEEVKVEFQIKNKGDTGNYLIETGIIPKSVAKDWGLTYVGGGFTIFDWFGKQYNTECCEGQQNIFAKTTKLTSGEIDTFTIKIPQSPYSEIADLCYDNVYWNGAGEYVLYIIVKTGCYPDGELVTYETRLITISGEDGGIITSKAKAITWSEFYSISDDSFYAKNYYCLSDSQCPTKEGYDVICQEVGDDNVGEIAKREIKIFQEKCDKGLGPFDEILNFFKTLTPGFSLLPNLCDGLSEGVIGLKRAYYAGGDSYVGYCVAESNTWYGKLWEGALKMVGGMGLPAQYVLLITIMILITLLSLIIRMGGK